MASECQGKSSWPELLGKNGNSAAATIERENPNVDAMVVLDGTVVITDFRCDRVWVWVNSNGNVVRVPRIGVAGAVIQYQTQNQTPHQAQAQMAFRCKGKSSWPELVGVNGEAAAATIESQNHNVNAIIVPEGSSVILDFRCNRVWVWVSKTTGKVIRAPKIG